MINGMISKTISGAPGSGRGGRAPQFAGLDMKFLV